MVQENIKVVARIRPFSNSTGGNVQSCLECNPGKSTITVKNSIYSFDKTFDNDCTQEIIFNNVAVPIIDSFVSGINGTILAYGQTGSGKTYTMLGNDENYGIIPRAIKRIFETLDAEKQDKPTNFKYILKCSFLQIYNEKLYDLLENNKDGLTIQSSSEKITVKGAAEIELENIDECMKKLRIGLNQRKIAETQMNQESSRSHAVFMLSLECQTCVNGIIKKRSARLNMVDLAGLENQKQTGNTGQKLLEAGKINNSLSILGRVIREIIDQKNQISYRHSMLTLLLRDSLGGNSKTTMLFNVHSNAQFVNQTITTLDFAKSVKKVKNTAKINESFSCEELVLCKAENSRLRQENDHLKSEVSILCKEKSSTISKHEEKIENLEAQLVEAKDKIYELENNNTSFEFKETVVKELESKTNENKILLKENDQFKNDVVVKAEKIQELQDKIAELEEENDRLKCGNPYSNEQSNQDNDFDGGDDGSYKSSEEDDNVSEEKEPLDEDDDNSAEESGINDLKTKDGHPCEILSNDKIGQKMLFIFVSNERKNYYAYKLSKKQYCCVTCKNISVKISDDGYVEGNWSHGCAEHSVIDFEIVPPLPDNGLIHPLLVTFIGTTKNQYFLLSWMDDRKSYRCQKCSKHGSDPKQVYAKIWNENKNKHKIVAINFAKL